MDYKSIISNIENNQHLINMTPVEKIVEIGYTSEMKGINT